MISCYFVVPISQEKLQKKKQKKHTHTLHCFSLKNHGQSFSLNPLFLQFNSRINRGFNNPYLKKSEELYFAKTNSAKIYIWINIYSVKTYSLKFINTKILVNHIDISVSGSSAFYFLNV